MSSTEQAPEPTMDEILASIRKIIADDDQEPAQQQPDVAAAPAPVPEPPAPDTGDQNASLVDDIANALNQAAEPAAAEDDIFDLTKEVAEAAPADQAPPVAPALSAEAEMPPLEPQADSNGLAADAATLDSAAAIPESEKISPADLVPSEPQEVTSPEPAAASDILPGAPMEETALPDAATGFGNDNSSAADLAETMSNLAATLEAAGTPAPAESADLDSFGTETPQETTDTAPAEEVMLTPAPALVAEEANLDTGMAMEEASLDAPAFEPEATAAEAVPAEPPAADLMADAASTLVPEAVPEPPAVEPATADLMADAASALAPEPEAAEMAEPAAIAEPAAVEATDIAAVAMDTVPEPEEAAAPAADMGGGMTLEDSVKEMLKPMLREWLDDNMQRIIEDAVKDEIKAKHNQF